MKSARPIALWLAAVIVTIAAALMPSGARAHGDHGHGIHGQVTQGVGVQAQSVAVPLSDAATAAAGVRRAATSPIVRAAAIPVIETSRMECACPACSAGGVCSHAPSSCCATGLAPSPVLALTQAAAQTCVPARDGPRLSGIVPEAQIEPPRPFV